MVWQYVSQGKTKERIKMQTVSSPKKKLRVLIADDIQETRRNTRLMLATIDDVEVVAIAANGLQAVQLAEEHHPDILLLDINMPELDGLSAYKEIAQIHPDIGCIIISAEKDTTTLRNAMSIGVQEYLIKPFTIEELETAIARVYERVLKTRQELAQSEQLRRRNEAYLKQLASEYAKARRSDDQAVEVFERLAENPQCELRWLQNLAMIYIIRQMWGRLKILAEKVEQRKK
ncbi:MAG: response regulator [Chloroflexi bacterium]|nr:MAG: response regulator [Chloroflexota bacterium]